MSKQAERRTSEFQAVRDAIQSGSKLKDALAAEGVTSAGYWQWCQHNGLGKNVDAEGDADVGSVQSC